MNNHPENTLDYFLLDSVAGVFITIFYLLFTHIMDKIINPYISNFIGLIINYTLNYFIQIRIFEGSFKLKENFLPKYLIVNITGLIFSQLIFMFLLNFSQTHHKNWHNHISILRWISSAIVYITFVFPLTRWWIFKE